MRLPTPHNPAAGLRSAWLPSPLPGQKYQVLREERNVQKQPGVELGTAGLFSLPEQLTDGVVMEPGGEAGLNPSAHPYVPPGCSTGTQVAAGIGKDGKYLAIAPKAAHNTQPAWGNMSQLSPVLCKKAAQVLPHNREREQPWRNGPFVGFIL